MLESSFFLLLSADGLGVLSGLVFLVGSITSAFGGDLSVNQWFVIDAAGQIFDNKFVIILELFQSACSLLAPFYRHE